jgi:hypothetical protein
MLVSCSRLRIALRALAVVVFCWAACSSASNCRSVSCSS